MFSMYGVVDEVCDRILDRNVYILYPKDVCLVSDYFSFHNKDISYFYFKHFKKNLHNVLSSVNVGSMA